MDPPPLPPGPGRPNIQRLLQILLGSLSGSKGFQSRCILMVKVSIVFMLAPRGNLKEWGEDGGSGGLAVAVCIIITITRQQQKLAGFSLLLHLQVQQYTDYQY
jgi:hypothetical protein